MEQELINKTAALFDKPEKWYSFLELTKLKDKLIAEWSNKLKGTICAEIQLDHKWKFNRDGMQWYLEEFGVASLSIWLEGSVFSLYANDHYFDTKLIVDKLKEQKFDRICNAVTFKETEIGPGYLFVERGKFEFDCEYDNNFDSNHLIWFANNQPDAFIRQLKIKLKPFFEATDLLIELNNYSKR